MNYVNSLLYPVSESDCPSYGRVVLYVFFGEITSKSFLLMFTLLSASKIHFGNSLVHDNCINFL